MSRPDSLDFPLIVESGGDFLDLCIRSCQKVESSKNRVDPCIETVCLLNNVLNPRMSAADDQDQPLGRLDGQRDFLHFFRAGSIRNERDNKKPGRNFPGLRNLNKMSRGPGAPARPWLLMLSIEVVHVIG